MTFRLRDPAHPRGSDAVRPAAALIGWTPRPSPSSAATTETAIATGRGIAYVHYKRNETSMTVAITVEIERTSGMRCIVCAYDCSLMINPNTLRAQDEGNLLQTLWQMPHKETTFDRERVTSVDGAGYRLLRSPKVPLLDIAFGKRRDDPPLGAGEGASAPVPAALANTVFNAVGARLRTVPFTAAHVSTALG